MSFADLRGAIGAFEGWLRTEPRRYAFAILSIALATGLRYVLGLYIGYQAPFVLYTPTIIVIALLAGFWPGFVATLIGGIAGGYLFMEPRNSFAVRNPEDIIAPLIYTLFGIATCAFVELFRRHTKRLEEFERVIEGLDERIAVVDRNYRYVIANPAFLDARGAKKEDVIGRRVQDVVNVEALEFVKEKLDECFAGKIVTYSLRYQYPVRGERDLVITYYPLQGRNGVDRAVSVVQDVTEQKRADAALRESERRLRLAQEVAQIGTFDRDLIAGESRWTPQMETIYGLPPGGFPRTIPEFIELLHPDDRQKMSALVEQSMRTGEADGEWRVVWPNGQTHWIAGRWRVFKDEKGTPVRVIGMDHDITRPKQAEEAARESEEMLRIAQQAGRIGTFDANRVTGKVRWSPEMYALYGLDAGDFDGTNDGFLRMIHPDDLDRVKELIAQGDETGEAEGEWRVMRRDGTACWIASRWKVYENERGEPVRAIGIDMDITLRKQAEETLRQREEDYRRFVAQSSEGIFRQDLDAPIPIDLPEDELAQRILHDSYMAECNDAMVRMYGLNSVQDFLGKRLTEFLDPNNAINLELVREYVRSGFRVVERESRETDLHGNPKVFRNSMIGIVENGKMVRTWGIQRDVTEWVKLGEERRKAEEDLRASETHFRLLVDQASDGIFLADAQGRYLDANAAGAEMLGYTREEILQKSIADMVATEEIPRIAPEVARYAAGAIVRSEWKFRRKDGSTFVGEVNGRQLPNGNLQGILRDMTERKRAEEILRQNEERFRVALKDSPITVFNHDRKLRYTWIYNPCFLKAEEAIGRTDDEILGREEARHLNELKRRVLESGVALRTDIVLSLGGKSRAYDVALEPLLDAHGNIIGITGAYMDVARLWALADSLRDAKDRLAQEKSYLESEIQAELGFEQIVGQSAPLREVLKKARIVAPTDSTVLLLGETGTGKELVARSVHALSGRCDKTFVKLNCAAVPAGLLESELFGHEKGAFTSAVSQKIGRIELADKGTLFLDEIGELPLELQPKLLRVLQDREFERLGGVRTLRVDVRIIAATNRDLRQDIVDRVFREDLYYRLNVFPIEMPPLRERSDDIPMLVHYFVEKCSARMGKPIDTIPEETIDRLRKWTWPGNVRELENMIERMVILTKGRVLAPPPVELESPQVSIGEDLEEMERNHIIRALHETNGILSGAEGAAVRLGLKRTTLQSMLKRFGIDPQDFRRATGTIGKP